MQNLGLLFYSIQAIVFSLLLASLFVSWSSFSVDVESQTVMEVYLRMFSFIVCIPAGTCATADYSFNGSVNSDNDQAQTIIDSGILIITATCCSVMTILLPCVLSFCKRDYRITMMLLGFFSLTCGALAISAVSIWGVEFFDSPDPFDLFEQEGYPTSSISYSVGTGWILCIIAGILSIITVPCSKQAAIHDN
jgi:hypothetical protein